MSLIKIKLFMCNPVLLYWVLQIIINQLIADHESDAFKSVPRHHESISSIDRLINQLFGGFNRWDSVHFLHIAEFGYTFEQNLAFSPFYPYLVRVCTGIWVYFVPSGLISVYSSLLLTAVVLNGLLFAIANRLMYTLTKLLYDPNRAKLAAVLFAINPSIVFFLSCYSESLYLVLTLAGLCLLYDRSRSVPIRCVSAATAFGLSALCRSNGMLNIGFVAFVLLEHVFMARHSNRLTASLIQSIIVGFISAICCVLPYLLHAVMIYERFCGPRSLRNMHPLIRGMAARNSDLVLPGDMSRLGWCSDTIPLFYSSVQSKYWNVGFFGYYTLRKLPLFVIAAPTVFTVYLVVRRYLDQHTFRVLPKRSILPFVIHATFLTIFGLFFINVEVLTRLLFASNPILIWMIIDYYPIGQECPDIDWVSIGKWIYKNEFVGVQRIFLVYFVGYALIGFVLHCNGFPWT